MSEENLHCCNRSRHWWMLQRALSQRVTLRSWCHRGSGVIVKLENGVLVLFQSWAKEDEGLVEELQCSGHWTAKCWYLSGVIQDGSLRLLISGEKQLIFFFLTEASFLDLEMFSWYFLGCRITHTEENIQRLYHCSFHSVSQNNWTF